MTKCGVEALDLVYGALKWQQLVLGFPPWTHAAQQKGVLTFQGHWIRAAVLNNNNDNNNSGTDGDKEEEKEHVPSPYRVSLMLLGLLVCCFVVWDLSFYLFRTQIRGT